MDKNNYLGKNPRKKKKEKQSMRCPYCGAPIQMVPASEMDFSFDAKYGPKFFWRCTHYPVCDAYIRADERTKKPSGVLANEPLRYKRRTIHQWKNILVREGVMDSETFMGICGQYTGNTNPNCVHIRNMTDYPCDMILKDFENQYRNNKRVKEAVDKNKFSAPWCQTRGIVTNNKPGLFMDNDGNPIERPENVPVYLPVVTAGIENSKELMKERQLAPEEEQMRMRELAHKYVLEAQKAV